MVGTWALPEAKALFWSETRGWTVRFGGMSVMRSLLARAWFGATGLTYPDAVKTAYKMPPPRI